MSATSGLLSKALAAFTPVPDLSHVVNHPVYGSKPMSIPKPITISSTITFDDTRVEYADDLPDEG